jgi:hypothetical protein
MNSALIALMLIGGFQPRPLTEDQVQHYLNKRGAVPGQVTENCRISWIAVEWRNLGAEPPYPAREPKLWHGIATCKTPQGEVRLDYIAGQ